MSSLPNEISFDITNFLPNDDITDLMLMSRKFNAFVTPRLKKINEDRATMNQSIKSPVPEINDDKWIAQQDLKKFEPIGSVAKKQMKAVFESIRNGHRNDFDALGEAIMIKEAICGNKNPIRMQESGHNQVINKL
ncbi:hypothetical protein Ddc_18511 [Ditylenchus destructor]|nr:hypothetical protein Ddc_18511 [Ditylenchus destructor]